MALCESLYFIIIPVPVTRLRGDRFPAGHLPGAAGVGADGRAAARGAGLRGRPRHAGAPGHGRRYQGQSAQEGAWPLKL